MVNFPAKLDNIISLPTVVDNLTAARAATINRLRDAILAIERSVGTNPSGGSQSIDQRFTSIENALTSGGSPILFGRDLEGTATVQFVVGIQGNPIAPVAPTDGYALTWSSILEAWTPEEPLANAVFIQGFPVSPSTPGTNQVLGWNNHNNDWEPTTLTQDMIGPAFAITLSGGGFVEVKHSIIHPAFTATYINAPTSAVLSDSVPNSSQNVISTPTSFSSTHTYVGNTFNSSVTFTLTAGNSNVIKTANTTLTWVQRTFYGIGSAGQNTAAFIQSLGGQFLTNSQPTSFNVTAGANQYIYFASRAAYGVPIFSVGGFAGGFNLVSNSIAVTNAFGFVENYQLWQSTNANLGNTTVAVQ